ncbi:MAG: TraB/GumN family protein [Candidatus Thermoplasmatota archaeon]|nr:TraB/GumN family protein [Candidatus Thermoplasmatota archaeon]
MITLIGTGHVFDLSDQIQDILEEKQPDIVCVELDEKRYASLLMKRNGSKTSDLQKKNVSFLYQILGRFQEAMAAEYGVHAGDEMLTGIKFAHDHQLPMVFIDRSADQIFARMIKEMGFLEKIRLFFSALGSLFVSKKQVDKEIKKLDTNLEAYLEQVGDKFPTVKRVLIDERNKYMVKQLLETQEAYENIVAIVGDGHIPGLLSLFEQEKTSVETIRLKQIRNKQSISTDQSTASFSIQYQQF